MAGALLSVLALRGIPHSTERTLGWLHVAAGRTDRWFRWGILATCIQLVAVLCGLPFGAFGIVWAHVISMYLLFVPALAYAGRPLGIRSREVIAAIGAQLTGSLISAGVGFAARTWLLRGASSIERTAVLVLLYLAVYLAVVVGLFRVTEPISVCLSLMKDVLPRTVEADGDGAPARGSGVSRSDRAAPAEVSPSAAPPAQTMGGVVGTLGPGSAGAPERPVRHSGWASWHALYRLVIGFCLVPVAGWWWGDGAATWRLVLSFLFVLVMLRIVPAVVRHVLPFPQDVKAEWARERLLAKRFDSYQWRKLLWFGLGLVAHLLIAGRALAVPSILALTLPGWRRPRHLAVAEAGPIRSGCRRRRRGQHRIGLARLNRCQARTTIGRVCRRSGADLASASRPRGSFSRMAFQCGHLEAQDVLAGCDDVDLIGLEAEPSFRWKLPWLRRLMYRDLSRRLAYVNPGLKRVQTRGATTICSSSCARVTGIPCT